MNHYDYATLLACGLDRWSPPRPERPHEREARLVQERESAKGLPKPEKAPLWRRLFHPARMRLSQ